MKVPIEVNFCEKDAPGPMTGEFQISSGEPGRPEVEVWATMPVLVHRTVSPMEIVIVVGVISNRLPPSSNNETL